MTAALVALAALAGLLLAILALPVEVAFRLRGADPLEGQVAIRLLLGLVRLRLPFPTTAGQGRPARAARRARPRGAPRRPRRGVLGVLQQAGFRRRAMRLAGDLLRATHPRGLALRLRLGAGDPAETGRLWALVGPLEAFALGLGVTALRFEPDFSEPALEFEAQGRLVLVPLQLLGLVAAFALAPASLRAWRTLWVARA